MTTINQIYKPPKMVKELDQIEDGLEHKRMGPELVHNDSLGSRPMTSDAPKEKGLDMLNRSPTRIQETRPLHNKAIEHGWLD